MTEHFLLVRVRIGNAMHRANPNRTCVFCTSDQDTAFILRAGVGHVFSACPNRMRHPTRPNRTRQTFLRVRTSSAIFTRPSRTRAACVSGYDVSALLHDGAGQRLSGWRDAAVRSALTAKQCCKFYKHSKNAAVLRLHVGLGNPEWNECYQNPKN